MMKFFNKNIFGKRKEVNYQQGAKTLRPQIEKLEFERWILADADSGFKDSGHFCLS